MTGLLDKALDSSRTPQLPTREEIAGAMAGVGAEGSPEPIDAEHRDAVLQGLAQLRRGEYASDRELGAAFRSFGP